MACGKCLSLEEARRTGQLDRFCKEHPSHGDMTKFYRLLDAIARSTRGRVLLTGPDHERVRVHPGGDVGGRDGQ